MHVQVIGQAITREKNSVARIEFDCDSHINMHVGGANKIGYQVAFLVMQRSALIEKSCFNGKAGRRMRHCL